MARAKKVRKAPESTSMLEDVVVALTHDKVTIPRTLSCYMAMQVIPLAREYDVPEGETKYVSLKINTGGSTKESA